MKRPVTMQDIAREAKTSVTTVCRSLQGKSDIGEATKAKIKAIAERLEYVPNVQARALRLQKSKVIGIIVPKISYPFYATLIELVEQTARSRNYTVVIANTDEETAVEQEVLATFSALQVAGLLAAPVDVANYRKIKIPLVFLARRDFEDNESNFNYIISDNVLSGYLATRHLIERGLKKVYLINGPKHISSTVERLAGYRKAIEEAGIKFNEKYVINADLSMESGYKAFQAIIAADTPPFGVYCLSDYMALGVMRGIYESQLKVGEDVKIIGNDDIELASYIETPLTTIEQSSTVIGYQGVETLLKIIENPEANKQIVHRIILKPQLVVRKTT
jgi:LacI family transcriptional regulator